MLKIKLFAAALFLAIVSCVFLCSNSETQAQSNKKDEKRDEILEKIAAYKGWKRVQKPEIKTEPGILKSDEPTTVFNSTAMG